MIFVNSKSDALHPDVNSSSKSSPSYAKWHRQYIGAGGFDLTDTTRIAMPASRLLDVREVAAMLNVSPSWVRDHSTRKQPRLPVVRLGSLLRFRREDILTWIDEMRLAA